MPKTGDFVEIIDTGKREEMRVHVAGVNIANRTSGIKIDMDPFLTRVTLEILDSCVPVNVRGFLVAEEDMKAFREWRAEKGMAGE